MVYEIKRYGFDCIMSSKVYLDILPSGVNKGSSLLLLAEKLSVDPLNIITCGDSLNDLPLFETGCKSIAVGNSCIDLKDKIRSMNNVYLSVSDGVEGIIEGLKQYHVIA